MNPTLFLGIETSCDETAAAVFTDEPAVLANVVASQTDLHARFGGVVPEVAARAHLQRLLPVIDEALRQAGVRLDQIAGVAVHHTPGLVGALLVGVSAAKMLAVALDVPLLGVNHVHGHVYACRMAAGRDIFPCVGLVVSGGHTTLFHCRDAVSFERLGGTLDDAAGEAFDKVASLLGLGFPGGPAVEREAADGDPRAVRLPRSFLHEERLDFSFSGLKTAVLYALAGQNEAAARAAPAGQAPRRPGGELSGGGGGRADGEMPAGAAAHGAEAPGGRRRRGGQPPAAGRPGSDDAPRRAPSCSSRRRPSAPTTPRWRPPPSSCGAAGGRSPLDLDAVPTLA